MYICVLIHKDHVMPEALHKIIAIKTSRSVALMQRLALVAFCVSFMAAQVYASEQPTLKQYYDAGEVIIGGQEQEFSVAKGETIRITAGESVRLLPGTKIEAGAQVIVESGKKSVAKEEKENNSILFHPEVLATSQSTLYESHFSALPANEKQIGNSNAVFAVLPVQSNPTAKNLSAKKALYHSNFKLSGAFNKFAHCYLPVSSWGERPETIKVMRT